MEFGFEAIDRLTTLAPFYVLILVMMEFGFEDKKGPFHGKY